jgi:hypothetical protein
MIVLLFMIAMSVARGVYLAAREMFELKAAIQGCSENPSLARLYGKEGSWAVECRCEEQICFRLCFNR